MGPTVPEKKVKKTGNGSSQTGSKDTSHEYNGLEFMGHVPLFEDFSL